MADIISAISVLLVFLTFLLNIIQEATNSILKTPKPPKAQIDKLERFNSQILEILWGKAIPVSVLFIMIFYIVLPKAIKIIKLSDFNLWNFDELNTLFIVIEAGILGLVIFGLLKVGQLTDKYFEK